MITFSRKKAAARLPSLLTSHQVRRACTAGNNVRVSTPPAAAELSLQKNLLLQDGHSAEKLPPHYSRVNTHSSRAEHTIDGHEVPAAGRTKPLECQQRVRTHMHSYEPQEPHQPHEDFDFDTEFNTATSYTHADNLKHSKGSFLLAAPVTTNKSLATKSQHSQLVTPLTDPDTLSGGTDLELSSQISAGQSGMSSDNVASSYAPSCMETSPIAAATAQLPVAKPPQHPRPRTFTQPDHSIVDQQTSTPWAPKNTAKSSGNEAQVLQVLYVRPLMLTSNYCACSVMSLLTKPFIWRMLMGFALRWSG